ncbi:HD domain-containing protein [bacterium]|nr:HD domain-containing protein [bacterium]
MITQNDIYQLFKKLLDQIQDAQLRDKVAATWTEAAQQGQWDTIDELHKMPFTLLTNTRGVNFVEHTIAVTTGAVALAEAQQATYDKMPYEINRDWLIAGGLLHDVGKLLEFEKTADGGYQKSFNGKCTRHPISGAILAARMGLPLEIINMIGCHAKEGDGRPQRIETVLIHQADFATFNPMVMLEKGNLIL